MIFEVGRVCVKTAGRDAGQFCAVVKVLENNYVEVAGATRSRKVNTNHLEPLQVTVDVKGDVRAALIKAGLPVDEKKEASAERQKRRAAKGEKPVHRQKNTRKEKTPKADKKPAKAEKKSDAKPAKEEKPKAADKKPAAKKE